MITDDERSRARQNVELIDKYIFQKDQLYEELKSIVQNKKRVKDRFHTILTLQGEIEYIRRLLLTPTYGVFPTCTDPAIPQSWSRISHIEKFF